VIPVPKIMYGYSAGAGTGGVGDSRAKGEGGGGGGAVRAVPVGVIEIRDQQTRFVPNTDRKKLTGVILAGMGWVSGWVGEDGVKPCVPARYTSITTETPN
jgi:uncharacterized spore protein YtfJ